MQDPTCWEVRRWEVRIGGAVQGVGFRPFVWRLARSRGLTGSVRNTTDGVTAEIQGPIDSLRDFVARLPSEAPPLAVVGDVSCHAAAIVEGEKSFEIETSHSLQPIRAWVSPDVGLCADCEAEIFDPADRRYRYPFTNCTACGPRYSIIRDLPYDRPSTSMAEFTMCDPCRREYDDPADRRFHAQPNACPRCGPFVWFATPDATELARHADAIKTAKAWVRDGRIVAIKGIGGFHFACDATNDTAVGGLRERKRRIAKPLAVMVADVATCRTFARVDDRERELLESRERPIVLLRKSGGGRRISRLVAPQNESIGVMLAYSPLHALLIDPGEVWVMTSGNLAEDPIAFTNDQAFARLADIADGFLMHDRDIETECDDSVVRSVDERTVPIRRSRGWAPLPIPLHGAGPTVLAVGGELKATVCVTRDAHCFISQHIGDAGNVETLTAMRRAANHLVDLYDAKPEIIAADLHPDYLSTRWARRESASRDVPLLQVQHHFAHVASLLAEHRIAPEKKIIGVCFDGAGYGTDGSIWGGEWLVADALGYERVGHLSPSLLPGGDAAVRCPARVALSQLHNAGIAWSERIPSVAAVTAGDLRLLRRQLDQRFRCPSTTSVGRLFDAVASLCGVRHEISYEGQAAVEAESIAADDSAAGRVAPYRIHLLHESTIQWDCRSLIAQIVRDLNGGEPPGRILARFHVTTARAVLKICRQIRRTHRINEVGLTGGVFQNALLLRLSCRYLSENGFEVFTHSKVPCNDGGICLGQAWIAANAGAFGTVPANG